ncbi:hypothetical protein SDC9_124863 [bioreactor metagenome]|uniref:Uncharacterized protein n=1 Tax=bioreactor metagenome TaxID=1076179 RepID=A0A645CLS5_9ZZZZ
MLFEVLLEPERRFVAATGGAAPAVRGQSGENPMQRHREFQRRIFRALSHHRQRLPEFPLHRTIPEPYRAVKLIGRHQTLRQGAPDIDPELFPGIAPVRPVFDRNMRRQKIAVAAFRPKVLSLQPQFAAPGNHILGGVEVDPVRTPDTVTRVGMGNADRLQFKYREGRVTVQKPECFTKFHRIRLRLNSAACPLTIIPQK